MKIKEGVCLKKYNSWKVGGAAEYFAEPDSISDLEQTFKWLDEKNKATKNKISLTIISGGTNVLISDSGVKGLVVSLRGMKNIKSFVEDSRLNIVSDAGASKSSILKIFLKEKLPPALFLAGLPGDVGGGVVMNAGVSEKNIVPREFCEIVDWVELLPFKIPREIKRINKDELTWSYRRCFYEDIPLKEVGVVVRVGTSCSLDIDEAILKKVMAANKLRLSKQPLNFPSCGSVFRNPIVEEVVGNKKSAGALIEQAGLKGLVKGEAEISKKHANFIINKGNARSEDIKWLIEKVQSDIKLKLGINLITEVVFIGF